MVDLRSDTVTRPSSAMREAMASAVVGDHVLGDDPTGNELEEFAAMLLGKERALFFPSGTMANQTAILVQAQPGTEVWVDPAAHILGFEEAAAAALGGVQLRTLTRGGPPTLDEVRACIPEESPFRPRTSLLCLENTHNSAGGKVLPLETMAEISAFAKELGLGLHLDGARLPNAAVATGRPMSDWARHADTVMVSLSKGLGAPIGSILAGSAAFLEPARRVRRRLGGGMRQVGFLAAAGLFALRKNLDRLTEDHRRARELAAAAMHIPGITARTPETNIVMLDLDESLGPVSDFVEALGRRGVLMVPFGPRRARAVTHLDIDDDAIEHALDAMDEVSRKG